MKTTYLSVALAFFVTTPNAFAASPIEALGAQRCGPGGKYEVEFLAPENATVEATAKGKRRGTLDELRTAILLSRDGRGCSNARCSFSAKKGETYKFVATAARRVDELCIVVARPSS